MKKDQITFKNIEKGKKKILNCFRRYNNEIIFFIYMKNVFFFFYS